MVCLCRAVAGRQAPSGHGRGVWQLYPRLAGRPGSGVGLELPVVAIVCRTVWRGVSPSVSSVSGDETGSGHVQSMHAGGVLWPGVSEGGLEAAQTGVRGTCCQPERHMIVTPKFFVLTPFLQQPNLKHPEAEQCGLAAVVLIFTFPKETVVIIFFLKRQGERNQYV